MRDDIVFIKGQGASKRVAAGQDYISGLIIYCANGNLPAGFTPTANIVPMYSPVDAVNAGILNNCSDETKATATLTVTAIGTLGDQITVSVNEPFNTPVILGTYTKLVTDTTVTLVAAGIVAAINAGTKTTGYTATNVAGVVTITARVGLGLYLNTNTPLSYTLSAGATLAVTMVAFSGGVGSRQAVWYYHISEFFRGNPSGKLWVGFFPIPAPYLFAEITLLQAAAGGTIRQVGIYKDASPYALADLTAIDVQIKTYNDARHKPLSALYGADLSGTANITTIADASTLTANKASSIIGQDGAGQGALLYLTYGKSITQLGIALGMLSLSAVSEDFGEPAKFNISNGTENSVPAFANGVLLSDPSLSDSALDAIDSKRHIFGQLYIGFAGTFFNENHCAITAASDYAYINDNRVIDKACRGIYTALIPYLKSRLIKNADGTLATTTIAFLETQCLAPLYQMARDGDLSAVDASDVYIDPTQNVTSTNLLVITTFLNEDGIARNISIPISYK